MLKLEIIYKFVHSWLASALAQDIFIITLNGIHRNTSSWVPKQDNIKRMTFS